MHEQFRFGEVFLKIQRIHCREEKKNGSDEWTGLPVGWFLMNLVTEIDGKVFGLVVGRLVVLQGVIFIDLQEKCFLSYGVF